MGPFLGYQSGFGLRGYLALHSNAMVSNDTLNTSYSGVGLKLDVGYALISWLALNLEYHMVTVLPEN